MSAVFAQRQPITTARVHQRAHARSRVVARAGKATQGKGQGDLDVVRLTASDGTAAEVYLFGGVVTSFKPKGGDDVLYVRPDAKFDKSKPVREEGERRDGTRDESASDWTRD
jgi:hypothetical protein